MNLVLIRQVGRDCSDGHTQSFRDLHDPHSPGPQFPGLLGKRRIVHTHRDQYLHDLAPGDAEMSSGVVDGPAVLSFESVLPVCIIRVAFLSRFKIIRYLFHPFLVSFCNCHTALPLLSTFSHVSAGLGKV